MNKTILLLATLLMFNTSNAQSMMALAEASKKHTLPHYPSLSNANIKTRIRSKGSAMSASYTWWSIFRRPEKRQYFVNINEDVRGQFICYQFDHLNENSRHGVFGHELAHLQLFHSLNFFGFLKFIINQGLPNGIKRSERATDYRTIEQGLGIELRSWSNETRTKFKENNPAGKTVPTKFGSRYLSPPEIDSAMKLFPALYQ